MKLVTFLILFTSLLACAAKAGDPPPVAPKLVLVISVDQLRYDYLTRFADLYTGGFQTLLRKGAVFANANYRHANTETGPGHAVILTGRHASHSGIIANQWYDRYLKKVVNVVDDPTSKPVGGSARAASPTNLIGFTVGDMLKNVSPESRVVGVALKDRSAVLMGGKKADAAYWFDWDTGLFVSSTYYMKKLPAWLEKWNSARPADQYAKQPWTRLKPDTRIYDKYAGPDAIEGEWDRKDIVFPHLLRSSPGTRDYYSSLSASPVADELTLQIVLSAMKEHALGTDAATDIYAVGFSATDIVGHTFGPDSHEILDHLLRLDQVLGRLLDEVERTVGMDNTLLVLTADHGVQPLVEILKQRGVPAERIEPKKVLDAVNAALTKDFPGVPGLVAHFEVPSVYLDDSVMRKYGLSTKQVESTVRQALLQSGYIEAAYMRSNFLLDPPANDPYYPLVKNSFFEPRSPNVMAVPKKYYYIDNYVGGTGHGTPFDYDRHVPIVLMGPAIRPGTYTAPAGPEDIAPTLAHILNLAFPKEDDARVLTEALVSKAN